MSRSLIDRIRDFAQLHCPTKHAAASDALVERTEAALGLRFPKLLKACYAEVGNGGFGPGYGLIGLDGGAETDFGTLVSTYRQLRSDMESEGEEWQEGLLPFCDWGCNIFTCIDCTSENGSLIYSFEDCELRPQFYSLEQFFQMWIKGVDIRAYTGGDEVQIEITNPFTGDRDKVSKRKA